MAIISTKEMGIVRGLGYSQDCVREKMRPRIQRLVLQRLLDRALDSGSSM